ncbi:MAG TPA: RdgB/HAM1 family non-canonical purine NTP pyrophosphatase [Rhizomicrobium sp.]|nr:RdgB/HAM1 family non-canonical purine NTP pyrophosphatase [Rhizomicrobium sp.]
MKLARGSTLVIASHNKGKVREIRELLAPFQLVIKGADELDLPEPEETEPTFVGNALLKARAAANASHEAALADDSGLAVNALGGAPGIYSARWAGEQKDFAMGMARVERELKAKNVKDYSARFISVLALAKPDGETAVFEGVIDGTLTFPPRGTRGFGYDPIFVANGMTETFGEIEPALKHAISHRARAFKKLLESGVLSS